MAESLNHIYAQYKHLGDYIKEIGKINKDLSPRESDLRIQMLHDFWCAIEKFVKLKYTNF